MKRMKLSPDEVAIIEGLRHEAAIYDKALDDVLRLIPVREDDVSDQGSFKKNLIKDVLALRRGVA